MYYSCIYGYNVFPDCAIVSIISNRIDINLNITFPQVIDIQIQRNLDTVYLI